MTQTARVEGKKEKRRRCSFALDVDERVLAPVDLQLLQRLVDQLTQVLPLALAVLNPVPTVHCGDTTQHNTTRNKASRRGVQWSVHAATAWDAVHPTEPERPKSTSCEWAVCTVMRVSRGAHAHDQGPGRYVWGSTASTSHTTAKWGGCVRGRYHVRSLSLKMFRTGSSCR